MADPIMPGDFCERYLSPSPSSKAPNRPVIPQTMYYSDSFIFRLVPKYFITRFIKRTAP